VFQKVRDRIAMVTLSDAGWSAPRIAAHLGSCGQIVRERAARALADLKAKAAAGRLTLDYLDECGFAPTLPGGYGWTRPRGRRSVRYEAPQGRRVNALAAYRPYGRVPRPEVLTTERTRDSYDLLGFLKALPWSKAPRAVVLDNASIHTSEVIRRAREELADAGIDLYFLPPDSPELNPIEPVFRQVKHQEIPRRSFPTRSGLWQAVEVGFTNHGRRLRPNIPKELRPAA
jgi:putative transposase